jgi:hypothetical protein
MTGARDTRAHSEAKILLIHLPEGLLELLLGQLPHEVTLDSDLLVPEGLLELLYGQLPFEVILHSILYTYVKASMSSSMVSYLMRSRHMSFLIDAVCV